jgi:hypothetical protein
MTSRVLDSLLPGLRVVNPGIDIAVLVTLAAVTLIGALQPARVAAAKDPLQTLRE